MRLVCRGKGEIGRKVASKVKREMGKLKKFEVSKGKRSKGEEEERCR